MIYLIVNPVAGRGRALASVPQVEAFLRARRLPFRTLHTLEPGHATRLVCNLPEDARVLSLGGDGTLHEVAVACTGTQRTLGVLPGGSGDDFAFALGLDRHALIPALEVAVSQRVRCVDTARVNGAPFFNALGIGFDAEVAHNFHSAPAVLRERSAYLYAVVQTLRHLETPEVQITVDDRPFYRGPALLTAVLNGPRPGGSFLFAPGARVDDGQLNLIVGTSLGRLGILGLVPKVMGGRHLGHPKILSAHGRTFRLRWAQPRRAHLEGQLLPATQTFEVSIQARSLNVASPNPD
ncbi:MAG TPA: diacylglycerol kinase family protein [Trueperaceae bacterium]